MALKKKRAKKAAGSRTVSRKAKGGLRGRKPSKRVSRRGLYAKR